MFCLPKQSFSSRTVLHAKWIKCSNAQWGMTGAVSSCLWGCKTHLVLGATACIGAIGVIIRAYLRKSRLPPSPPTWRLRGHFLPPHNTSLTVAQWIDEYGPLVTVHSGIQTIYCDYRPPQRLNTPWQAAVDIMEKQGGLLADRPHLVAGEILTCGLATVVSHAGERFRRKRSPNQLRRSQPLQVSHAKDMVLNILDDPYNFQNHAATQVLFYFYAAATIMKVTYGKTTPTSATDPEVKEACQLITRFRTILRHGYYLVDSIPWLKYLLWYAPELKDESERIKRLYTDQLNHVKQQIQINVDVSPSFAKHILENGHFYSLTEI
ncbi:uncharacterized protein BJ212DRAFT_1301614 [Suillus subaureus]|uniref:Cytochrome P450 n=1 Tax=Suillus subaureus TaxID=48587 RepID=A0A9P7JB04_9AGAM|nr:uncharacterized protein BJ212DRAFT_1301614 [Suillus subaureus]KAG1812076.1 hypothetical protein BJ212DRAFT_1301614 [Suillus subaureus]